MHPDCKAIYFSGVQRHNYGYFVTVKILMNLIVYCGVYVFNSGKEYKNVYAWSVIWLQVDAPCPTGLPISQHCKSDILLFYL